MVGGGGGSRERGMALIASARVGSVGVGFAVVICGKLVKTERDKMGVGNSGGPTGLDAVLDFGSMGGVTEVNFAERSPGIAVGGRNGFDITVVVGRSVNIELGAPVA